MKKIDPDRHIVHVEDKSLRFDYLVLALGSQTHFYDIPGLQEYTFSIQTLTDAQRIHDHIACLCAQASSEPSEKQRRDLIRFVMGGGGLSGVEFAGELADRVRQCTSSYHVNPDEAEIIIIEAGDRIVPYLNGAVASSIQKTFAEKDVKIIAATRIVNQTSDAVEL